MNYWHTRATLCLHLPVARFQAAGVNTWLNSVMAVGLGQMVIDPVGVEYSFYELR